MITIILVLIIIIIILILKNIKLKNTMSPTLPKEEINYDTKYVKRDYLLTQTELKFYKLLKTITDEMNLTI